MQKSIEHDVKSNVICCFASHGSWFLQRIFLNLRKTFYVQRLSRLANIYDIRLRI